MPVQQKDFPKLMATPAAKIFAVIVDLYGRRMADDIAREVIKPGLGPQVEYPKF